MKTPTNYGGWDVLAYLQANNQFCLADLYTVTLVGGYVARYTSAETDLTVGGNVFKGQDIFITRNKVRTMIGVEVDTLDLEISAQRSHLLNGTPWLQALRAGAMDGATVKLERLFTPSFGSDQMATFVEFLGKVADMEIGRTGARVRVNSWLDVLNIQMPRNMFQAGCLNTLYDGACALSKAAYAVNGTVTGGNTSSITTNLTQADDYFSLGTITFTSGVNNGVTRSIKKHASGALSFALPLVSAPVAGDTFTAYPGCDKTMSTCSAKFNNLNNLRGFPFVPAPESVL